MELLDRKRMANLTQLVERLAHAIPEPDEIATQDCREKEQDRLLAAVRDERLRRTKRAQALNLDQDFFFDPAWDILLELFHASLTRKQLSPSSIGLDLRVAASTVLRWLEILENHQLINRQKDPNDKRRSWVSLTETALHAMASYFS